MAFNTGLLTSKDQTWETPQAFFARLNEEFSFTLDAAADGDNAKCLRYYTEADDGLSRDWSGETVWLNPPYGRQIGSWVRKAFEEGCRTETTTVVMLIPARTCTPYWHDYVMHAEEVRFVRGRLRFSGSSINAPFPCAVVVFDGWSETPLFSSMDR